VRVSLCMFVGRDLYQICKADTKRGSHIIRASLNYLVSLLYFGRILGDFLDLPSSILVALSKSHVDARNVLSSRWRFTRLVV
jgi:hypothetical protein